MAEHQRSSPVHMTEEYWCQPSRWSRNPEPFSDVGREVTCPDCLTVLDGSCGDDVVHMATDQMSRSNVVPLCRLSKTRIHTRQSWQVTCRRCLDMQVEARRRQANLFRLWGMVVAVVVILMIILELS